MNKSQRTITPFRVFILLLVLVGVYFLLPQLGSFKDTFVVLRHAFWPWMLVGLLASLLTFFAGAIVQFAAGNLSGRFTKYAISPSYFRRFICQSFIVACSQKGHA